MKNYCKGFTLIELIIVTAIIAILSLVAMPSFVQQVKQNRIVSNTNKLHSTYKFARSEAAKRDRIINLDESSGLWQVKLEDEVLFTFSASHSSISVTGLADQTIQATGDTTSANYLITDGDSSTSDYRLCIYVSGQSYTTDGAC
ncbi:MAG: GspH/FimT family pseudopilin [Thalassotalea sp.]